MQRRILIEAVSASARRFRSVGAQLPTASACRFRSVRAPLPLRNFSSKCVTPNHKFLAFHSIPQCNSLFTKDGDIPTQFKPRIILDDDERGRLSELYLRKVKLVEEQIAKRQHEYQLQLSTSFPFIFGGEQDRGGGGGIPPVTIDQVLKSGGTAIPRLLHFLGDDYDTDLQFEAARALTDILSQNKENTFMVIEHGAAPRLVELLSSQSLRVRKQVALALGYIAGTSPQCRDLLICNGVIDSLHLLLEENITLSLDTIHTLRIATWTLANLCKGKPQPPLDKMSGTFPLLKRIINLHDMRVTENIMWTMSFLTDGDTEYIQVLSEVGMLKEVARLLCNPTPLALQIFRNIGMAAGVESMLYAGSVAIHEKEFYAANLYFSHVVENRGVQVLFDSGVIDYVVGLLEQDFLDELHMSVKYTLDIISSSTTEQIWYLMSPKFVELLCGVLGPRRWRHASDGLEALESILKVGEADKIEGVNHFATMIDEAGGVQALLNMKSHAEAKVVEKAAKLLETYFGI